MHHEAYAFVASTVAPLKLSGLRVLEIGSVYVNGSVRPLFAGVKKYVGIDERDGPEVDVVCTAAAFAIDDDARAATFDIVVTCETLEHADPPAAVIACAARALKPEGLLIITAAGPDREPHGCDGGALRDEPYTAIDDDLLAKLLKGWDDVTIAYGASHGKTHGDIYATARKKAAKV